LPKHLENDEFGPMNEVSPKRTALFEEHQKHGARFVPFSGYEMPVQYTGIVDEHQAVRNSAGLFDVSHMGVSFFRGPNALNFVNSIITRDVSELNVLQGAYTLLCHENGGTVDDLIVYRSAEDEMLLVFNASNKEKDFEFFSKFPHEGVELIPASENLSLIALQGPKSPQILKALGFNDEWPKAFEVRHTALAEISTTLLFTGYTGEIGCEIVVHSDKAPELWSKMMQDGKEFGLQPCGLGARDTLRLEMGFSLYGHELNDQINPVEAGLGWAIGWKKENFHGKAALEKIKENKQKKIVALKSQSRQAPRQGMKVLDSKGNTTGEITSGSFSPGLGVGIALALVDQTSSTPYSAELRPGKLLELEQCKRPFITKEK